MFHASLGRDVINSEIRRRNLKEKMNKKLKGKRENIIAYSKMLSFCINERQANTYWPDYLTMSILWFRLYHLNELWFSF